MFLDGLGLKYKRNPSKSAKSSRTMGWTRPNQALDINFTAKRKKDNRKKEKFYVGISYGKGVVMCNPCTGCINTEWYCKIIISRIDDSIQNSSSPREKHILQENWPVMNATYVVDALTGIGAMHFKIVTRSPDINWI